MVPSKRWVSADATTPSLARQCVLPVELLCRAAGFAEHADDLAVERELVDPPRLLIVREEILRRPVGDADRPRLRLVRTVCRQVAQHRMPALVVRHGDPDEPQ